MGNTAASYDKKAKIWNGGKEVPVYDPDRSIGEAIFRSMKNNPENIVQISDSDGISLTSGQALTAAIRIAQHFKKMGLHHEEVIGVLALNTTYLMPMSLACFFNCTPFHAVNPVLDDKTLTNILALTKPKVIFCDGQDYDKILRVSKSFKPLIYTLCDHIEGMPKVDDMLEPSETESDYSPQPLTVGGRQSVAILCSSGTTGFPKAICISNNRIFYNLYNFNKEDVLYAASALDWLSGVIFCISSCLYGCARLISSKPYSTESFIDMVRRHKVTICFLPPPHVALIFKCSSATFENLATIRMFSVGSSFIALSIVQRLHNLLKNSAIGTLYGLTESGLLSSKIAMDGTNSVGNLLPGIRARIVDDDGNNLGPNNVGEIYATHGKPWNGYYGNPKDSFDIRDEEGWFRTGDLGYFDDNQSLYIVDRKKNILKYNGMQYWPTEIENCIAEIPEVENVCVVGIYDESCGDAAGALVVPVKGSLLNEQYIKDYVVEQLIMPHKQLNAGVLFVDRFPMNQNGKTINKAAKVLFESGMAIKVKYS